ncbi:MAG: PaREP1 family protein, partial [Sulfolobaceae archaeon]
SEKAYKVAKEVVKALSEKFNLPEYQQAVKEGRWYTYLLGKASSSLAIRLGLRLSLRFHEFAFNLSYSYPLFPSPCRLRD